MDAILSTIGPAGLVFAFAVGMTAGVVKGVVGFAMPMITIAGLGSVLSPELALAGLILPTVATNLLQALRQGARAAWESIKAFRVFLFVGGIFLVGGAQLVRIIDGPTMLLLLGVFVTSFVLLQLIGVRPRLARRSILVESVVGAVAGFIGGMSGVWGPPTVMYLTALDTPKADAMRVQGVIYGLGAVLLLFAHVGSGILNADTAPFSALLVAPALLGMWIGARLQDRIDQQTFRRLTLLVLLVAGLNLVRRGLAL